MSQIRASIRLFIFLVILGFLVLVYLVGFLLLSVAARLSNAQLSFTRRRIRWRQLIVKWWSRGSLRILGIQAKFSGDPPKPPFCLVSNHLSYLDVIVFQAQTGCVLISKSEVAKWPFIGKLSSLFGTIFIDRRRMQDVRRVSELIHNALRVGEGVVFFPEGTTTNGQQVGTFKSSLLHDFATASYPVHFASISYSSSVVNASNVLCWWDDIPLLTHLWGVFKTKSSTALLHFGNTPIINSDRKQLAALLQESVTKIFTRTDVHSS